MIYFEEGTFKRYEKEITDKSKSSKTGKRKVQQLNITGLSKNSKFKDGQRLSIIDFIEFNNLLEDYNQQKTKVKELSQQVQEDKLTITELEGKLDKTPETISNTNKILELVDKLDQKQTIIDTQKTSIIKANLEVNNYIDDIITELTSYFADGVNTANISTQSRVINLLHRVKEISNTNIKVIQDVQDQTNTYNKNYDNANRFKKFFMKKITLDFEELESNKQLLTEFNSIDIEDTAKNITKSFTIDSDKIKEIKNNSKVKSIDFNKIFLENGDTLEDDKESNSTDNGDTQES